MRDNEIPWGKTAVQIIEDVTKTYNIPILYRFPLDIFMITEP
jgi:muramoyltetrapeptide carboxypeptidase